MLDQDIRELLELGGIVCKKSMNRSVDLSSKVRPKKVLISSVIRILSLANKKHSL